MLIEARPTLDPELAVLVAAQQREGGPVFVPDTQVEHLVAVVDGRAVACAAWQPLPETGVAELQRLYVRPAFRGRGIARQLIVAVEEEALAAGRSVMRLATGTPATPLFPSSEYHLVGGRRQKRLALLVQ